MVAAKRAPPYRDLVANMYARSTLDVVIEIARAVSLDYIARPDFYRGAVPDSIVPRIAHQTHEV